MSNTNHTPYIKLSIGLIAATTAIDQCVNNTPNSGDYNAFMSYFDWSCLNAHVELAILSKAVYTKEVSEYDCAAWMGRHKGLSDGSMRNPSEYQSFHQRVLMPVINLMKGRVSELTANDLCSVFTDSAVLDNETYGRLKFTPSVIRNLMSSMNNRRDLNMDNISVHAIAHILASVMVFGKSNY